jgi:hypothetical protein
MNVRVLKIVSQRFFREIAQAMAAWTAFAATHPVAAGLEPDGSGAAFHVQAKV